ncbi:MAG: hypothetical protein MI976_05630 [Pseudomonadales bacterium]|nr:hypothetical protein [Pseudomonadales bacterium]
MYIRILGFFIFSIVSTSIWASEPYSVEVAVQPGQRWHFQRLNAHQVNETFRVSGRLTSNLLMGLPRGHVDIAAYSPSGKLLAQTTTYYVPSLLTHTMRKKGGVRFTATLAQPIPPDAVIKVAFHKEQPKPQRRPAHSGNIAR